LETDPSEVYEISLPGDMKETIDTQTFDALLDLAFEQALIENN